MKGYANIVVKGKNGEVKREFTEGNVVFDLPRILLQKCLDNVEFGGDTMSFKGVKAELSTPMFEAVVLYDENISTTDPTDINVPLLYGSPDARSTPGNQRYAQRNSVAYGENDSSITQNWVWSITEDMTLRSMALKRASVAGWMPTNAASPFASTGQGSVWRVGNKYVSAGPVGQSSSSSRRWVVSTKGPASVTALRRSAVVERAGASSSERSWILCHDNEYVVLEGTSFAPVFNIYDTSSAEVKRSFAASQFEDIPQTTLTSVSDWSVVVSTTSKDYLLVGPKLYVLPRIPTEGIIPLKDTATVSGLQYSIGCAVFNRVVFGVISSGYARLAYKITNDDKLKVYEGQYTNSGGYTPSITIQVFSINSDFSILYTRSDMQFSQGYLNTLYNNTQYACNWLHHTALNFSSPLELTAGDTLSVTYTVSAV